MHDTAWRFLGENQLGVGKGDYFFLFGDKRELCKMNQRICPTRSAGCRVAPVDFIAVLT